MISTATQIKLKRSGVPGRKPTLADLQLGELGINYADGKLFYRQENSTVGARIIQPGQTDVVGKTIFVTKKGNDNNSGLNERDAVATIKKAAEIAQEGDSIKVYPGQYIEDNPIVFKDRVSVEGMELRNVLVTPGNPDKDLYLVGEAFHATNHSFVSNQDAIGGAAIISFRPLEGTASDRYFDAARLIRDNLDFIAGEAVGFLTSGYSGYGAGQRSIDGARAIELNRGFIAEEAFQYINSPDYQGPNYFNPDINQCRRDLRNILDAWRYDLISDGNSETVGAGLTYYAPKKYAIATDITDVLYNKVSGRVNIKVKNPIQVGVGEKIKLQGIRFDCPAYDNDILIVDAQYDNKSGIVTVTLPTLHNIQTGDSIKLQGLKFDCAPYGAESYDITDLTYNEVTGVADIKLSTPHNLKVGDKIELRDIRMECPAYGGQYADIVDLDYNNITGRGTITFATAVDLEPGDVVRLYDIKMTCPAYGNAISVSDFVYDNFTGQSVVTVVSPHNLQPGDLIKLENLKFECESYLDQDFRVTGFTYNNFTGESVITLDKNHSFVTGDQFNLDGLVFSCNSYLPTGKSITNFVYNKDTGVSRITLDEAHGLSVGENIRLEGITFSCNSYSFTDIPVASADYDKVTGYVTIGFANPHGQDIGDRVRLSNLEFSCPGGSGITTTLFPDGTYGYEFTVLAKPNANTIVLNVGTSVIDHTYIGGGTATVGITTTLFPDGTQGYDFTVTNIISANVLETNVGISTIAHTYVSGGTLYVGFTTTVFPDGSSPFGSTFTVENIPSANQIVTNVGVSTIAHTYIGSGKLSTIDTFIGVTNFVYDEAEGTGLVTLDQAHGLFVGDSFILEDLTFNCDSYVNGAIPGISITDFVYDEATGISTISLASSHNLLTNDKFRLEGIEFTCPNGSGITTTIFPDGTRPNFYDVVATPDPNTIITNVGISTIQHTYASGGTLYVGITTNIFPDGTRPSGKFFKVISVPSANQLLTNVGVSSIAHSYASGGRFYTGITTNVFPQVFSDPTINVTAAVYNNVTGQLDITTDKPHRLSNGESVLLRNLEFSCTSGGPGNTPGNLVFPRNDETYVVQSVVDPYNYTLNIGPSDFAHTYLGGGISIDQNVVGAVYNHVNGELTVTLNQQHGFAAGDRASIAELVFSCLSGGPNNGPGNLIFPRPTDEFTITSVVNATNFVINVGAVPTLPHTYENGGSVQIGNTTVSVTNAVYNEQTGDVTITTAAAHGGTQGATVKVQGLEFSCLSGGPGNDPGKLVFPRLDAKYYNVVRVVSPTSYVINVGAIPSLPHTYVSGGYSTVQKKENDPNIFKVLAVPSPTKVITNVGPVNIEHTYLEGGNMFVGITTNIFPDGTRPQGIKFEVISAPNPNQAVINIGVSTIQHFYESGGRMQYGQTNEREVVSFIYDNKTGLSTVTVSSPHGLTAGQDVKLQGLEFSCIGSPGITTTIFPDGTAPSINIYKVRKINSSDTFEINVGRVDFVHNYQRGGSVFVGITTNVFPDGTQGYEYTVRAVKSNTEIVTDVGISSFPHEYVTGGKLFAGRTNERDIKDFDYDFRSGESILTFRQAHGLVTGDLVKLQGLKFDCPNSTGITTTIFPDGSRGFLFQVNERINSTQVRINVGPSPFAHNYVRGTGAAFVGITTDIFPDPAVQPTNLFKVVDIPAPNKVAARVGPSTITHFYQGGGSLFVGINTDIFPGDATVSPRGDILPVESVINDREFVVRVGVSTITHNYVNGTGQVLWGESQTNDLQHITGPGVLEATIAAVDFERQIAKKVIDNRPWGSFTVSETARIKGFDYDNQTGIGTVWAPGIKAYKGDLLRMSDIEFRCSEEYAGVTTTFFPDNTRPEGQYFTVSRRISDDRFEVNVGVSTIIHRYNRGGNVYRYSHNIQDVSYQKFSGIATITSNGHGFRVEDVIELRNLRFECPVFNPTYTITNFVYDNKTGLSTVTTNGNNTLSIGDRIKINDIEFRCPPYGNERDITNFVYDNTTGASIVTVDEPHGININKQPPISISNAVYDNVTGILTVTTTADMNFDSVSQNGVILQGLTFSCTSSGFPGTLVFPEEQYMFKLVSIISPTVFAANVGVSTLKHDYVSGGTAVKVDRKNVKFDGIRFDCPSYGNDIDITDFLYDNTSGQALITLAGNHNLNPGDDIKLENIRFECPPYGNAFKVIDAKYTGSTGILTVTTNKNLPDLTIGSKIRVRDIQFDCDDSGIDYNIVTIFYDSGNRVATITIDTLPQLNPGEDIKLSGLEYVVGLDPTRYPYPDGRDPSYNIFRALDVRQNSGNPSYYDIDVRLGVDDAPFALFDNQGTLTVGITTNIFPENNLDNFGKVYEILNFPADNEFTINVGTSTITHTYYRGGEAFVGVTTNIFPDGTQGNFFKVQSVPGPNQIRTNVGISSIPHVYVNGGSLFVGITTNTFPDGTQGDIFPVLDVLSPTSLVVNVGPSSIPHIYNSGGQMLVGITTNIFPDGTQSFIYDVIGKNEANDFIINVGPSSIPHTYYAGGTVTTGITTDLFPEGSRGYRFEILDVIDSNNFTINVGPSTITHIYADGGLLRRVESPVRDFIYDKSTGISTVTVNAHKLNIGDLVRLRDIRFDCDPYGGERNITNFIYDNTNGRSTVTVQGTHGLRPGDNVKLADIQFDCTAYGNEIPITNAQYTNTTGILTVTVAQNHNFSITDDVKLAGLEFACPSSGITTTIFPDGTAPGYNIYAVIAIPSTNQFVVNVGVSTIIHNYVGGGSAFVGITTNIFPDGSRSSIYRVLETPTVSSFTLNVGVSTISHNYLRGGYVQTGITTDLFPDGTRGDFFVVKRVLDEDTFIIDTGISSITHRYNSGGFASKYATYQSKNPQILDTSVIRVVGDCKAVGARVDQLAGITTDIIENGPSAAPGGPQYSVTGATYDHTTGLLEVTLAADYGVAVSNIVRLDNLEFSCESKGFTDSLLFPDTPRKTYEVLSVNGRKFTVNVGTAPFAHDYVRGGNVRIGKRYSVVDATYDEFSGVLDVYTDEPNYMVENTGVHMEGMVFNCPSGGPNNAAGNLVFPDGDPAEVVDCTYDNKTGLLVVTTDRPHQAFRDAKVRLEGLEFSCTTGGSNTLFFPTFPDRLIRVTKVIDNYTYEAQLKPTIKNHVYVGGGTHSLGTNVYRVARVVSPTHFQVQMAPFPLRHTYVSGGSVASIFNVQFEAGLNLRTAKCADDVKKTYLAVAHDITRGGNMKVVEGAKRYRDAINNTQFISGGEIIQTVDTLEYSLNVVRNLINNVTWGGLPRGYYTKLERKNLKLYPEAQTSVVGFGKPEQLGQITFDKKLISGFVYNNVSGIATVTTTLAHEFKKNDAIRLADIKMTCIGSPRITTDTFPDGTQGDTFQVLEVIDNTPEYSIADVTYDNTTGELELVTAQPNNIPVGTKINLKGLVFSCSSGGPISTALYPESPEYTYTITDKPADDTLKFNVGISTIAHTYEFGGTIKQKSTQFRVHVGTVGFPHIYAGGGSVWRMAPFTTPRDATQLRDVSQQIDPIQRSNATPNSCANVFRAIQTAIGVATAIILNGFDNSGIVTTYPGNDGKGVATPEEMPSQGVGNIIKGPYIRNCTNFVPKSIGMRMDGFDAEPGDEISNGVQGSSNVDSFTQFNPGGVGCSISNGTYQQLVSIFTICCDEAISCDSGAQLDLTNSNSSFGRLGLVARGIGDAKSKCIDRYTGTVAIEALIDDDRVTISGISNKRPYDGQGIYFGELFREVVRIDVIDGGSGYDDENLPVALVADPTGPSGIKAEISPTVIDGRIVSIEVIANGNQYRERNPVVTIAPPPDPNGRTARAIAITEPLYYDVESSEIADEGTTSIIFKQRLNNTVSVGTTVYFSRLSLQIASSHSFEYIGAGNTIDGARPSQGGVPIKANEVIKEDGGQIVYTSTDQAGNFNIGDGLVINQFTGTVSGRSFDQSVLNKVTPLIIALDS